MKSTSLKELQKWLINLTKEKYINKADIRQILNDFDFEQQQQVKVEPEVIVLFNGWIAKDVSKYPVTRFYKNMPNMILENSIGKVRYRKITENDIEIYWGEDRLNIQAEKFFNLPKGELFEVKIMATIKKSE